MPHRVGERPTSGPACGPTARKHAPSVDTDTTPATGRFRGCPEPARRRGLRALHHVTRIGPGAPDRQRSTTPPGTATSEPGMSGASCRDMSGWMRSAWGRCGARSGMSRSMDLSRTKSLPGYVLQPSKRLCHCGQVAEAGLPGTCSTRTSTGVVGSAPAGSCLSLAQLSSEILACEI